MKLHCKHCDKQLTKSLYPNNWKIEGFIEDYYGEGAHKMYYIELVFYCSSCKNQVNCSLHFIER
jgi:hypothetical protein